MTRHWSAEKRREFGAIVRCHSLKIDYFKSIDTEEKAYWLGFLMADGCVTFGQRCARLALSLAIEDVAHIHKFRSCLGYGGRIKEYPPFQFSRNGKTYETQGHARLCVTCLALVEDLRSHGVVERKSFLAKPVKMASRPLQCAWWRGIIDGDGYLGMAKSKKGQLVPMIGCAGTFEIVNGFIAFVAENTTSIFAKRDRSPWPKGNIYHYQFGGIAQVQQIIRLLYENASVCLDRKKAMAERIMQLSPAMLCDLSKIDRQEFIEAKERLGTWNAAARHLGIPLGSLTKIKKRFGISRANPR